MSVPRACLQCRAAKAKCDLVYPSCGRCVRRGLTCTGLPSASGFIFRDENEAARRGSERARRESTSSRPITTPLEIAESAAAGDVQMQSPTDTADPTLHQQFYWLNSGALITVPEPLKRDLETRAVDRFFVNWIIYPGRDGVSPGYMHDLPLLYHTAVPGSVIQLAVHAVAFADLKDTRDGGIPFDVKARRSYGAALTRMRELADQADFLADDSILAALLLIDSFEELYLARSEPLGPHSDAITHVIRSRGEELLHSRSRFCLWRMANHRLQARQVLFREQPDQLQIDLMGKLDSDRPDIHIAVDIQRITVLCSAARRLVQGIEDVEATPEEKAEQAAQLLRSMQELITAIEAWTAAIIQAWRPKIIDSNHIARYPVHPEDHPLSHFPCPRLYSYHDLWLAYIWSFYSACQIVLYESLVEIVRYNADLQGTGLSNEDLGHIRIAQDAIERLSGSIIRSFPPLMGFTDRDPEEPRPSSSSVQGMLAGRFLALFAMTVIRDAESTSLVHKQTATKVLQWIVSKHGLG